MYFLTFLVWCVVLVDDLRWIHHLGVFLLVVVFDDNHCSHLSIRDVSVYLSRRFLRSRVSLFLHLEFASEYLIWELAKLVAL
jgi:hypothetical protein